jgi:hypothetical protein
MTSTTDALKAKALQPNQIWNFQTNSIRFKLAVVIGKNANYCQLESARKFYNN